MAIKKDEVNQFIAIYNIISTTSASRFFSDSFNINQIERMWIDEIEVTPTRTHIFSTIGNRTIKCKLNNFTSAYRMFRDSSRLQSVVFKNIDTSKVTTFESMFLGCLFLKELDLSQFDTSSATQMRYMFYNNQALTYLNVSSFDTSKVTNMERFLAGCKKINNLDLSNFNVAKINNFVEFFNTCYALKNFNPFFNWGKGNIALSSSPIVPLAIHQLIERASSVADGAVARTLTLAATTKTNWEASEYYEPDQAMATEKLISIT